MSNNCNMSEAIPASQGCETPGCDKEAKLQCPSCIKLDIKGSFFCSQTCFKGSWDIHKALHKLAKNSNASQSSKPTKQYNPWPGYLFTGRLRPAQQSATRIVPDHIPRPDYADHKEGFPLSEQKLKGNTYIRQLDADEIEREYVGFNLQSNFHIISSISRIARCL